jgi:hypothetical protein
MPEVVCVGLCFRVSMEVHRRRGVLSAVWVVGKSSGHVEVVEDAEVVEELSLEAVVDWEFGVEVGGGGGGGW